DDGHWRIIKESHFNRRITLDTEVRFSGPAAGHDRLKTTQDPTGKKGAGTLNNCSGGVTPWGTVLSGEENFHEYFVGALNAPGEAENHARYGVGNACDSAIYRLDQRFHLDQAPCEPNRFGWVAEIDPYHPDSTPVKRTALGRMKHEGAATSISHDGRVVVYMGDDETFEYFYKFVTAGTFDPKNPRAAKDLLDEGTLYVAKFKPDGLLDWMPLIFGQGPLTSSNGFSSQADVLIETRRAADLMGATPMDRPEDVEENPVTQNVFLALSNNTERTNEQLSPANPRSGNQHGHIIELTIPQVGNQADHTALSHPWEIFLLAGHLENDGGWYQGHQPETWISCPDNLTFDNTGRLWIATDGFENKSGILDGAYVCEVAGPRRALTKQFFHVPTGAELCGPCFTPDNSTLFVAVQHPGGDSTFDQPSTRWPNPPDSDLPPRPSVVAITRKGGGPIGG
ncbi:MAG: PhoX family phosphatase, partial [Pirellulaceae bacterium]|nr:PhoX family phosphatase [Pirellulaceae bacterium]